MQELLPTETVGKNLRALRIVFAVLIYGLVAFAALVWFLRPAPEAEPDTFLWTWLGVAAALLVAGWAAGWGLRRFQIARLRRMTSADQRDRLAAFFQVTFLRAAMAEGPGLLFLVTVLLTGSMLGLLGAAVCCALLLAQFPTAAAFARFEAVASGAKVEPG